MFTDYAAFHWLLTMDDPSGNLIRCRLRLTEFDFEAKYNMGKINTQADELSRLNTIGETIPHDDNVDIPVFELDVYNLELELKKIGMKSTSSICSTPKWRKFTPQWMAWPHPPPTSNRSDSMKY